MKAFLHHLSYELNSGFRDKSRLLMNYLFPLVFAVFMGAIMGPINPIFKQQMIPAMTIFALMCSAFLMLPSSIVTGRICGIYRSFKINAVPKGAIIGLPIVAMAINGIIVTLLIVALSALAFGAPLPQDPWRFCVAWLVAFLAIAALGTLVGTISPNERAVILIAQIFYIPSIMLGGLMMPASVLPAGLKEVSLAFPATHAMNAFLDPSQFALSVGILGAMAVLCLAISVNRFKWMPK